MDVFLFSLRARDGTRTRDPDLGKVVLHQLSHSRILSCISASDFSKYTGSMSGCQGFCLNFLIMISTSEFSRWRRSHLR